MDTITHVLTGAVMSGPAKEKLGWVGPAALIAGSFSPDLDFVLGLLGSGVSFKYHRVFTDSLLGLAVMSPLTAYIVWRLSGRRADFKAVWLLVFAAYSLHIFMDFTNSYGIKPFWPFNDRWYALDSVFIIDPFITGLLILCLALTLFKVRPMAVAAVCFALLASYWGMRIYLHTRALDHFKAQGLAAVKVCAFPAPVNPFVWRMVAERPDRFDAGWYNLLTGGWKDVSSYEKTEENDAVKAAMSAPTAKDFLGFARFPWVSHEKSPGGWTVYIQDLRFSFRSSDRRFVATVRVSDDGKIEEERFGY